MSLEAVKLSGRRRVAARDVILGDVISGDIIGYDVVAAAASTLRLRHGAPVRRHHSPVVDVVVAGGRGGREAAVAGGGGGSGGRRSRRLGEPQLLEDAALDRLDAGALQQDALQHAAVHRRRRRGRVVDVVVGGGTLTIMIGRRLRQRGQGDGQPQRYRPTHLDFNAQMTTATSSHVQRNAVSALDPDRLSYVLLSTVASCLRRVYRPGGDESLFCIRARLPMTPAAAAAAADVET